MKPKSNLSDPHAPRLAHFVRAFVAIFRGKVGGKPWLKHLHRGWRSLLGDPRFLPKPVILPPPVIQPPPEIAPPPVIPPAAPDPTPAVFSLGQKISALNAELARHRNLGNPTLLRHLAELGNPGPVNLSYRMDHLMRGLDPLLTRRSERVCVVSLALGRDYRQMVGTCLQSQSAYCERHGYSQLELGQPPPNPSRPFAWFKIPLALRALELGFEQIFYIDADCLITNSGIPLDDHFTRWDASHGSSSILLTEDEGGINSGCFFLRNTPDVRRLLDAIWLYDAETEHPTWEQEALMRLLHDHEAFRALLHIEPEARRFNSFPHERLEFQTNLHTQTNTWQAGDFICHFSGIRSPHLERLIAQYETEIRHN